MSVGELEPRRSCCEEQRRIAYEVISAMAPVDEIDQLCRLVDAGLGHPTSARHARGCSVVWSRIGWELGAASDPRRLVLRWSERSRRPWGAWNQAVVDLAVVRPVGALGLVLIDDVGLEVGPSASLLGTRQRRLEKNLRRSRFDVGSPRHPSGPSDG